MNYATPALDKGLDILELLAHQSTGLTMSQLARELNRTVSEIFRMLVCLERRGYIAQVTEDRYGLTLKLFRLVQEHPPTEKLMVETLPVMKQLAHETQQSCHIGVLEGEQVVILAQVNSPTNSGFHVKPGSTVDLLEAASGYVILAHQPAEERDRTIKEWRRRNSKRVPPDLVAHLERIRKKGFEKRASYQVKGITNISFPIFGERGAAVGALTIPYLEYSDAGVPEMKVTDALCQAARKISVSIGGKAPS
jgi:DNA-binding IclR family transcriptional regulator